MATVTEIKKDIEFYQDFASLIEVLKAISSFQYHSREKRLWTFGDFVSIVEGFFDFIDTSAVRHPFLDPGDRPLGVIAVTSDAGLLGGLNFRVMSAALGQLKSENDTIIVIGLQGQNMIKEKNVRSENFPIVDDENRYFRALELRDYIIKEARGGKFGRVTIVYPFALSISVQRVVMLTLLPCSEWFKDRQKARAVPQNEIIFESLPSDDIEYLAHLWIGYKLFEIFQFSRLAEFGARVIHLEESSQKVKEINKKLKLKYARIRHEIIDQQMRELFTARSLYAR